MKDAVEKIVAAKWPELASRLHLPLLAVVTAIPDPPAAGGKCTAERPRYAVTVQLLTADGDIDQEAPEIADVPVALPAAAPARGFAALPRPGTVVELAFAFGRADRPFIRSVLPYDLDLPVCDDQSQRWQQTADAYQEVNAAGDWIRKTGQTITDQAGTELLGKAPKITHLGENEWSARAPKIWLGNDLDNLLWMVSDFMATVIGALNTLAGHTHGLTPEKTLQPEQSDAISAAAAEVTAEKGRVEVIKK